ncbi:MAG: hypothetical protein ACWGQW_07545, partial [bacterium]
MAIAHQSIDDSLLHEPYMVSAATQNEIFFADGAGDGNWLPTSMNADYAYSCFGFGSTTNYQIGIPMPRGGKLLGVRIMYVNAWASTNTVTISRYIDGSGVEILTGSSAASGAAYTAYYFSTYTNEYAAYFYEGD